MKKIIVPVDFSKQSEIALKAAASLARKKGSEIFVLHMLELSAALMTYNEHAQYEHATFLIKLAEKKFAAFLNKPYLKGLKITPIVKHHKVYSEVNEVVEKHNVDLIVMGSHGTDGIKEIFVGSNAEKMVRNSEIPVLVIKDEIEDFDVKRVVFACDFKEENIEAFQKAIEFTDKLSASLFLVFINTPGDNFLSTSDAYTRISKFLQKASSGLKVEIYNDYSVERGIHNFSNSINADLIGMPTHGRKGLTHFFMGSIGEDVVNHSKIPVITFKI
ncbi:Nucleotide-binding universal stress protein, UspA family [Arenibacter nanhaiticus]|uniref:Nucleotide-binding universal stress protein, UspA family n=1 Tax=Arenibacter nanhaiticus TaxID=558155 RepID=A0A1M6IKR3_9FLAO|nr:universal stress protein [Arenibacter nanhaiticus]SHJ35061.1 Nucleotide-binding universal stress protein, UspA family [Arenibacter nanhaiticus]